MGSTLVSRRCSPSPSRAAVSRRFSTGPTNGPCSWRPTASSHRSGPGARHLERLGVRSSLHCDSCSDSRPVSWSHHPARPIDRRAPRSVAGRAGPSAGPVVSARPPRWLSGVPGRRRAEPPDLVWAQVACEIVGLEPVEVDRRRIHELTPEEMHEYVLSDARLARQLVERRADRFAWVDQDPSSSG